MRKKASRVAVIGMGNVGSTFVYGLLMNAVANEVILVDSNRSKAEGEAMDLEHALSFMPPTKISVADLTDFADSDVIVITAGIGRKPGDRSRLDLAKENAAIFREMIPHVARSNPKAIFVIASNPVDVLTYLTMHESGLPPRQVIGSGTILDSARFRVLLSQHFRVDPRSVHACIIGEHGDSEVPVWSSANIAGMCLPKFCENRGMKCDDAILQSIFTRTRDAGPEIVKRKAATFYGVASGLIKIVVSILRDHNTVLTVSSLVNDYYGISDVCLSLPSIVNRNGVQEVLRLELAPSEIEMLRKSAEVLKASIATLELGAEVAA